MKGKFTHYYRLSDQEFARLLDEAIFVFDTNMLLNLYRYPKKPREDFFAILKKISSLGRIWLPFQVALEFQENRLTVIAEQKRKFTQVKKVVADIQSELKKKLDELQLKKRHSAIDPDALVKEINRAFEKYLSQLEKLEKEQPDVHHQDKVREQIDQIFEEKIGEPFSQAELDKIFCEGSNRYKQKQPPGYEDEKEKKGTFTFYGDLSIKREFGDLILWNEIIKFIQQKEPKGVILVTDDNKEDWWQEEGGKTIGPRPELLSEIIAKTGLRAFYMYRSERFLEVAGKHFGVKVEKETVEQVKMIAQQLRPMHMYRRAREMKALYENKCQICGFDGPVEVALIKPGHLGGEPSKNNMLLLCPNHHRLFDMGSFTINEKLQVIGLDADLKTHSDHHLSRESLKYHFDNVYVEEEFDDEE